MRPDVIDAVEALRVAASAHLMSSGGHVSRTSVDIGSSLQGDQRSDVLTTQQFADRLNVGPRHARRLAAEHGITSIGPGRWAAADAAALLDLRRTA